MREISGDIWDYLGLAVIAITTSGSVAKDGRAVLGRGCARQAGARFPGLASSLGRMIGEGGNHVHQLDNGLVSFPVEETAWSLPELHLILRSCHELVGLADREGWTRVVVPRPGCGFGGLDWNQVRPLLESCFDGRFSVISVE